MSSSPTIPPNAPAPLTPPSPPVNPALLQEIQAFRDDCNRRYRFNNTWDSVLTTVGILLSIAVVAAGFLKRPEISAILGAIVGAVVTAQKAFPFGQRASFYRLLIGQAENLLTRVQQHLWDTQQAVDFLATLRMDFAQELPRGTNTQDNTPPPAPAKTAPAQAGKSNSTDPTPLQPAQTNNTPPPPGSDHLAPSNGTDTAGTPIH